MIRTLLIPCWCTWCGLICRPARGRRNREHNIGLYLIVVLDAGKDVIRRAESKAPINTDI